jgi:hypothetical protein
MQMMWCMHASRSNQIAVSMQVCDFCIFASCSWLCDAMPLLSVALAAHNLALTPFSLLHTNTHEGSAQGTTPPSHCSVIWQLTPHSSMDALTDAFKCVICLGNVRDARMCPSCAKVGPSSRLWHVVMLADVLLHVHPPLATAATRPVPTLSISHHRSGCTHLSIRMSECIQRSAWCSAAGPRRSSCS